MVATVNLTMSTHEVAVGGYIYFEVQALLDGAPAVGEGVDILRRTDNAALVRGWVNSSGYASMIWYPTEDDVGTYQVCARLVVYGGYLSANQTVTVTGGQVDDYIIEVYECAGQSIDIWFHDGYTLDKWYCTVQVPGVGPMNLFSYVSIDDLKNQINNALGTAEYSAIISASTGGSVSPSGRVMIPAGTSITVTATPDQGWALDYWTVNGVRQNYGLSWNFEPTGSGNTIMAIFVQDVSQQERTVMINSLGNGTTNPSGTVKVQPGETLVIGATPNEGYIFAHWTVNGVIDDQSGASLTFDPPKLYNTVWANFIPEPTNGNGDDPLKWLLDLFANIGKAFTDLFGGNKILMILVIGGVAYMLLDDGKTVVIRE